VLTFVGYIVSVADQAPVVEDEIDVIDHVRLAIFLFQNMAL
jgi:hypothetical protein